MYIKQNKVITFNAHTVNYLFFFDPVKSPRGCLLQRLVLCWNSHWSSFLCLLLPFIYIGRISILKPSSLQGEVWTDWILDWLTRWTLRVKACHWVTISGDIFLPSAICVVLFPKSLSMRNGNSNLWAVSLSHPYLFAKSTNLNKLTAVSCYLLGFFAELVLESPVQFFCSVAKTWRMFSSALSSGLGLGL